MDKNEYTHTIIKKLLQIMVQINPKYTIHITVFSYYVYTLHICKHFINKKVKVWKLNKNNTLIISRQ